MTDTELDDLEAKAKAATGGKWNTYERRSGGDMRPTVRIINET